MPVHYGVETLVVDDPGVLDLALEPVTAPVSIEGMVTGGGPNDLPDFKQVASKVQAHIRKNFDYVGSDFAAEATAMHKGEKTERLIYGETTPEESKKLQDEGVPCTPLPDAFAPVPPKKAN